jgi:hypothetical protein
MMPNNVTGGERRVEGTSNIGTIVNMPPVNHHLLKKIGKRLHKKKHQLNN